LYQSTVLGLKNYFQIPIVMLFFLLARALKFMERTIQNCVDKYSFHFVNGSFFQTDFFETAQELGKTLQREGAFGEGFNLHQGTNS